MDRRVLYKYMDTKDLEISFKMLDKVFDYFAKKYDDKKAVFVCDRLSAGFTKYTYEQIISMGEKLALFNDWKSTDEP